MDLGVLYYDIEKYPLHKEVQSILGCDNLLLLHELSDEKVALNDPGKDQSTKFHQMFYSAVNSEDSNFMELYRDFVEDIWKDWGGGVPALYQVVPTFRVQLPNGKAVGGRSHRDMDYNHPKGEVNFLVPFTTMQGSSTIFTESKPGLRDFRFIDLQPGQVLKFNGNELEHGNIPNITGFTRVSIDFRVLPESMYVPDSSKKSVAHGLEFTLGNYYSKL